MEKKTIRLNYVDQDSTVTSPEKGPFFDLISKNYNIEIDDNPDYLIYGPFGDEHLRFFDAIKIFYTGECISPDFNECDYAIGFDYIDFGDRYFRYPLWLRYPNGLNQLMEEKHIDVSHNKTDRKFCSYVVSNDYADEYRDILFEEISKYKMVDSGGRYRNNIGLPNGVADKIEFQSNYKFALACENTSYPGYTTEKLMEAFASGTVPIYWGDPHVSKTFNPNSFIDCSQYSNIDELIAKIKRVDNDDDEYMRMLREPALISSKSNYVYQNRLLESFLLNIFNPQKEKAYRRNRVCWGEKYNNDLLDRKRLFDKRKAIKNSMKALLNRK